MPLSWQDKLDGATTEGEVVAIAKDFVAQFSPREIESLPPVCRPGKFFDANDVNAFAFALMRHECGDDREVAELVHKMAGFFANASTRLSQIMARPNTNENEADSRQSA
jgi:hypothetical protein